MFVWGGIVQVFSFFICCLHLHLPLQLLQKSNIIISHTSGTTYRCHGVFTPSLFVKLLGEATPPTSLPLLFYASSASQFLCMCVWV